MGVIRRGAYQAASEDIRWAYELVSDMWKDIEPDIKYSDDGLPDEGIKDQEKPDYQKQEEVVLVLHRNSRRL